MIVVVINGQKIKKIIADFVFGKIKMPIGYPNLSGIIQNCKETT